MKAVIIVPFRDKFTPSIVHSVGDVVDFAPERVANLASRNLVKIIEEAPEENIHEEIEGVDPQPVEVHDDTDPKGDEATTITNGEEVKTKTRKGRTKKDTDVSDNN